MAATSTIYAGAAISVAIFIIMIIVALELSKSEKASTSFLAWAIAVCVAIFASFTWSKATGPAGHLPLGKMIAGIAIFFTLGFGTIIGWSFLSELLGRSPNKEKSD